MILTHGANSLERGGDFVEIGGRKYPVVKIGNQLWMSENLDYAWNGLSIGPSGQPSSKAAWYLDNDETTNGYNGRKLGLMYNDYAIDDLITNHSSEFNGFHVPSPTEYTELFNKFGGSNSCAPSLKSLDKDWFSNWNGTDTSGMSIMPGAVGYGGSFNLRNRAYYWTSVWENHFMLTNNENVAYLSSDADADNAMNLRLVKDAT
jgi:uncharacterized protein (TIGR02145 family)